MNDDPQEALLALRKIASILQDVGMLMGIPVEKPVSLEDFSEWVSCKAEMAMEFGDIKAINYYASIHREIEDFKKEQSK